MKSCMPTSPLDLWDILVVLVVVNKFDLRDTLVKYVNSYLHVGINFVELCIRPCLDAYPHQSTCVGVERNGI
jgi:hypothetical protein